MVRYSLCLQTPPPNTTDSQPSEVFFFQFQESNAQPISPIMIAIRSRDFSNDSNNAYSKKMPWGDPSYDIEPFYRHSFQVTSRRTQVLGKGWSCMSPLAAIPREGIKGTFACSMCRSPPCGSDLIVGEISWYAYYRQRCVSVVFFFFHCHLMQCLLRFRPSCSSLASIRASVVISMGVPTTFGPSLTLSALCPFKLLSAT
jgi:hypothetical protein